MAKKKKKHKLMHKGKAKSYHSNLAGKRKKTSKKRRAKKATKKRSSVASHMSAANRAGVSYGEKVTAHGLQARAKRSRGKRWTCGGPVRSGCGGSDSKVIGRVR